tara:strand:- start:2849 stop:3985 length:1137 start_codon:yes stop_codon:yes gene_type:complete
MDFIISVLSIIFILSIPVFLHELGHFIAARSVGIRVEKFYIGFNPWGLGKVVYKGKETEYGIGFLPLGGYVKVSGVIDESMDSEGFGSEPKDYEFRSKNTFQKLWFLSAGVIMNFILSIIIFSVLFFASGTYDLVQEPIIYKVSENINTYDMDANVVTVPSPAWEIGLRENDRILTINDITINTWSDISNNLYNKGDMDVTIEWMTAQGYKKSSIVKLVSRPSFDKGKMINQGILGVQGNTIHRDLNFFESIGKACEQTFQIITDIFYSLIGLITGEISTKYMSGIVGIANQAGEVAQSSGFISLIYFMAFISANLGLINILPIPGLDGGHAFIAIIEGIMGRELPVQIQYTIQFLGIFLILSLFVFTIFNDIRNMFN